MSLVCHGTPVGSKASRPVLTPLGKTFEVLDENELGEPQTASPVISNGALYMRTYEALYANLAK